MSSCPDQFKLDVNDRYQKGVALVTSLSTASLILPILFLKDIVNVTGNQTVADALTSDVYLGWKMLAASIFLGVLYYFLSAKWVKLAWGKSTDIFWVPVSEGVVEYLLDTSYLIMMICFGGGMYYILSFVVEYSSK